MNGKELSELIAQRWSALDELLELGRLQTEAINAGQMSQLMRILSAKQAPLNRLDSIAKLIRAAADDDPTQRAWDNPSIRESCRAQQEQCDQMHLDLLAIEAACETALQENRSSLQAEILQMNASHQAAKYYAPRTSVATSGRQLDLSD